MILLNDVVVVQLLSPVRLFVTPQTAARQASLSLTISPNLPNFMSIASVMPSSHLIPWRPLLLLKYMTYTKSFNNALTTLWCVDKWSFPFYGRGNWGLERWRCCRRWDPFQGLRVGFCLTLRNEFSEETHVLATQEILLGRGTWAKSSRVREPRRTALPRGSQARVLWWLGLVWVVFSQAFWLRVLPGGACFVQPRWMPERRILGGGWTCDVPFDLSWTFLVCGSLLIPCSLPGPCVLKQLMHMVTVVLGQGGQFQSVYFP